MAFGEVTDGPFKSCSTAFDKPPNGFGGNCTLTKRPRYMAPFTEFVLGAYAERSAVGSLMPFKTCLSWF